MGVLGAAHGEVGGRNRSSLCGSQKSDISGTAGVREELLGCCCNSELALVSFICNTCLGTPSCNPDYSPADPDSSRHKQDQDLYRDAAPSNRFQSLYPGHPRHQRPLRIVFRTRNL